jgi:hypothetical protein
MKGVFNEVCLVTGASTGLGREIAKLLAEKGYKVYVTARQKDYLLGLKKECKDFKGEIILAELGDLSELDFRKKLILKILKKEGKIDYLINNAGYGRAIKFHLQESEEIHKMFEVNMVAYAHLARLILPNMLKNNKGRIINIGSVVAFTPLPYFTIYNSTKAAIYSFNRSLRYELRDSNVSSTVVLPARMKTKFAEKAYDCYIENGQRICVQRFNKGAGDPLIVARNVLRNINNSKEVITPTFKSKVWYFMRYFGFIVDFVMKNILGPKEKMHLEAAEHKTN